MGKELLRAIWLWFKCLIWAIILASPFFAIVILYPTEPTPNWEWLEVDPSHAQIIVVLIGTIWAVLGLVFIVGSLLKSIVEMATSPLTMVRAEAKVEIDERRRALLEQEEKENDGD